MTVPNIGTIPAPAALSRLPDGVPAPTQEWPLRSHAELRPVPASARCARLHARNALRRWQLTALADTVELLVSELVSNAIRAAARVAGQPGSGAQREACEPPIWFWLASDRRSVLIQVWDGDHHHPARREQEPDAEAGRGLLLVEALSEQWGCYTPDGQSGKIVWAICAQPGIERCPDDSPRR